MWTRTRVIGRAISRRLFSDYLNVSDEVAAALREGGAVVALESTVITHGMPYPANVQTAIELEDIVRVEQCVPATVAVADGALAVGISRGLMERLGNAQGAAKVSRRDLAAALTRRQLGGTTVSATMIAAEMAGISIFATGGIGGVHRDANESLDISADLTELGKTPVAVVCAGIKSILDVPKTLQYLETQGVPVIAYSDRLDWPGFFTRTSGCRAAYKSDDEKEVAQIIDTARQLNLRHGFVIGVPLPADELDDGLVLQQAIDQAVREAGRASIGGSEVTPFVLRRLNELTGGRSLRLNIALIKNNARVAARIAKQLSGLRASRNAATGTSPRVPCEGPQPEVVVVGGAVIDFYIDTKEAVETRGGTYPGTINQICGGVGRNHADALSRLGVKTLFISALGKDAHAARVRSSMSHVDSRGIRSLDTIPTATYAGFTVAGSVLYGVGSMQAHDHVTVDWVRQYERDISQSKMVVLDGNIPEQTISYVCDVACSHGVPVWFDPTDEHKVAKVWVAKVWAANAYRKLSYVSPNLNEFLTLTRGLHSSDGRCWKGDQSATRASAHFMDVRARGLPEYLMEHRHELLRPGDPLIALIITMGSDGVLLLQKKPDCYQLFHYDPPVAAEEIVNVSGAGDCLNAGVIRALLSTPSIPLERAVGMGIALAGAALRSRHTVPPDLGAADPFGPHVGDTVRPVWTRPVVG